VLFPAVAGESPAMDRFVVRNSLAATAAYASSSKTKKLLWKNSNNSKSLSNVTSMKKTEQQLYIDIGQVK
jgi:hypothetical protein